MKKYIIAIDGPSGSGKSSLAKALADKLGYLYIDTGALYRTIGLYMKRNGIDPADCEAVTNALGGVKLEVRHIGGTQHVYLDEEDVSDAIRENEISFYASKVSAHKPVRAFLLDTQRKTALENDVILDGRDIGTVIFPDADVKIFLAASDEVRAKRRVRELLEKGQDVTYEQILSDMRERDKRDSSRAAAPLVKAHDAVELDNGEMTMDGTIDAALKIINDKIIAQ